MASRALAAGVMPFPFASAAQGAPAFVSAVVPASGTLWTPVESGHGIMPCVDGAEHARERFRIGASRVLAPCAFPTEDEVCSRGERPQADYTIREPVAIE